jgi:hypothetical protein
MAESCDPPSEASADAPDSVVDRPVGGDACAVGAPLCEPLKLDDDVCTDPPLQPEREKGAFWLEIVCKSGSETKQDSD